MKKTLFCCVVLAGLLTACINDGDSLYQGEPDAKAIVKKFVMTEKFEVPIQKGYNTVVKLGEDTLYYGNVALSIDVPRSTTPSSRSVEKLNWYYVIEKPADAGAYWYIAKRYGLLAFEDMLNGDNDYNDFICGLVEEIQFDKPNLSDEDWSPKVSNIRIKPLAMGNVLNLRFGVEFRDKSSESLLKEVIMAENVRETYFEGRPGFINTDPNGNNIPVAQLTERPVPTGTQIEAKVKDNQLCTLWFIEVDGMRRYVADANSNLLSQEIMSEMVTMNKVPFGLFIPGTGISDTSWETTYKWPLEKKSIFEVYPEFNQWLDGSINSPFGAPQTDLLFNTSLIGL